MPVPALIVPFLILVAAAEEPPIVVKAYPWAPFISPMGEPFRPPTTGEAPIARWFSRADQNGDGILTAEEMLADADRFFARLDDNHDGLIDPQEIAEYEYELAPDVQVNSQWKRPRGEAAPKPEWEPPWDDPRKREDRYDGYRTDGLQGAARYGLLNIPQPVASADADFNRVITLAEFRQAASYRFKLLDDQGQGRIALPELEARLPARPKGKHAKPRKDVVDTRIGLPLPKGE
ncbi:EF-hand domain-containing protein [Sphingomonas sp. G124]|uniref:EF-hand domain-containing protein n=1 Tax=Sphingomonas cremea TaxID=2904799 RepID=A0A9X1QLM2_9SPHN|nr:EF-hand domain-containing protein [Sphingomonas cremea]MCF2514188.1 EF-hand domain-containing protein [Sphingomonas cremea]